MGKTGFTPAPGEDGNFSGIPANGRRGGGVQFGGNVRCRRDGAHALEGPSAGGNAVTVYLNSIPTSNTTASRIIFTTGATMHLSLNPNQSATLDFAFDTILVAPAAGGRPRPPKRQNPPANVTVPVGNIATVSQLAGGAVQFQYFRPQGTVHTVIFG
jgi:hypothetical protein